MKIHKKRLQKTDLVFFDVTDYGDLKTFFNL